MKKIGKTIENLEFPTADKTKLSHSFGWLKYCVLSKELEGDSLLIEGNSLRLFNWAEEQEAINFFDRDFLETRESEIWKPVGIPIFYKFGKTRKEVIPFEGSQNFDDLSKAIRIVTKNKCKCVYHFSYNKSENSIIFYRPFDFIDDDRDFGTRDQSKIDSLTQFENIRTVFANIRSLPNDNGVNHSPLLNAVRFLNHAQNTGWLNLKITLFFIALESIFCEDNMEVSFKMSLRASHFLYPDDKIKRLRVFKVLRNGYDLRSSFLHGSKVDDQKIARKLKIDSSEYSIMLDFPIEMNEIVCDILNKILTDSDLFELFQNIKGGNSLVEYLNNLVL